MIAISMRLNIASMNVTWTQIPVAVTINNANKGLIRHFVNVSYQKMKTMVTVNQRNVLNMDATVMESVSCNRAQRKKLVFAKLLILDCFVMNHVDAQ